jgi:fluoride ion exporter CrcB/FEX
VNERATLILAVALGGAIGALAREGIMSCCGLVFPAAMDVWLLMLLVNVPGSLAIGWLLVHFEVKYHRAGESRLRGLPHGISLSHVQGLLSPAPTVPVTEYQSLQRIGRRRAGFWMTGILGGLTTFSTFSLDVIRQLERGDLLGAGLNTALSLGLAVSAVVLGMSLSVRWTLASGTRSEL